MGDDKDVEWRVFTTPLGIGGELHRLLMARNRRARPKPLAFVTFQILGDRLVPAYWTRYLRRAPSHKHIKGGRPTPFREERRGHSPEALRLVPYQTGEWSLTTRDRVVSDQLDPHLLYLIRSLRLPLPYLAERLRERDLRARALCYWNDPAGDRVPSVDERIRDVFRRSGVAIEIDEYPREITMNIGGNMHRVWT